MTNILTFKQRSFIISNSLKFLVNDFCLFFIYFCLVIKSSLFVTTCCCCKKLMVSFDGNCLNSFPDNWFHFSVSVTARLFHIAAVLQDGRNDGDKPDVVARVTKSQSVLLLLMMVGLFIRFVLAMECVSCCWNRRTVNNAEYIDGKSHFSR